MSNDAHFLNRVHATLPNSAARQWLACSGDAQAAYAAARAALYRAVFVRCAQARVQISPAQAEALADILLPGVLDPAVDVSPPCEPHDPRLWGRLHEDLLAHQIIGVPPDLRLVPAGNRRVQGSYYTPATLARFIIRQAVGPTLDAKLDRLRQRWRDRARPGFGDLFEFSILDPALGTGYFLLEALDFITDRLLAFLDEFPDHPLNGDVTSVRGGVLTRCLYGIDLDSQAVGLARMTLWLAARPDTTTAEADAAALAAHLVSGNALLDADRLLPRDGFDAVIGNPPYVPWHAISSYRSALESGHYRGCSYRARPNHADAQPNLYLFFLVVMLDLLRPGGRGCYLLPPEWLSDRRAAPFVAYLAKQIEQGALLMFDPSLRLFVQGNSPVGTASMIVVITKRETDAPAQSETISSLDAFTLAETDPSAALRALDQLDLWNLADAPVGGVFRRITLIGDQHPRKPRRFSELLVPLISTGDRAFFEIGGGFQPPMALVPCFTLDETAYRHLPPAEQVFAYPAILHASSITRYRVTDEARYWIVLNSFEHAGEAEGAAPTLWAMLERHRALLEAARGAKWWRFPNTRNLATLTSGTPRILTPRTATRNSFALDITGYLFKGTNAYLRVLPPYDPAYVLALLNSHLLDQYYAQAGQPYHGNARRYEPGKIAHFPIRRIDFTTPAALRAEAAHALLGEFLLADSSRLGDLLASVWAHLAVGRADVVHDVLAGLARAQSQHPLAERDQAIDALVETLYGLTSNQVALLVQDAP